MEKKRVFNELRERTSIRNLRAPRDMDFFLDDKTRILYVTLTENGLIDNMQSNAAAFESWILAVKHYLHDIIEKVEIVIHKEALANIGTENYHFNRFVYRLTRFLETYNWVNTSWDIPTLPSKLVCNVPTAGDDHKKRPAIGSEGWIECEYVAKNKTEYDTIDHQLPVGLFKESVKDEYRYTTGQKSALDIWAIKGDELSIFELKKDNNIMIGIISELFFYTHVVVDIINRNIVYDESDLKTIEAIGQDFRGFRQWHDYLLNTKHKTINAVLLANNIHPLITNELLEEISNAPRWKGNNVSFKMKTLT